MAALGAVFAGDILLGYENGGNTYALPAGAGFLGFSADVADIDMAEVENHPMITSLSENTQPQVREAMVQQVITHMVKTKGLKPEKKTGYKAPESGKMSYDLK